MVIAAALYRNVRTAERHPVALDGTLRDPDLKPIDILVDDLSMTGFRIPVEPGLEPRDLVSLGLAGVGTRSARIVRRDGERLGCAFLSPLDEEQLAAALDATAPQVIELETAQAYPMPVMPAQNAPIQQLSIPLRLLAILGLIAASWATLIGARMVLTG